MVAQGGICGYEKGIMRKVVCLPLIWIKSWSSYIKHGYCPEEAGLTIQWAFEDWALGEMAKAMGKLKDYNYYRNRSWAAMSWHPV